MNREKLETGFAKLVKLQRYIQSGGVAAHIHHIQTELQSAMAELADGCNELDPSEPLPKSEWEKECEEFWKEVYIADLASDTDVNYVSGHADEALEAYKKRFSPYPKAAKA